MIAKEMTLAEIAGLVEGELQGPAELAIHGVMDIKTAQEGHITFIVNKKLAPEIAHTKASAVIVPLAMTSAPKPIIRVADPYLAMALTQRMFTLQPFTARGISPAAQVGANCLIPAEISIFPGVVIGNHVTLGSRITLYPGVVIGDHARIGDNSILHANVCVEQGCLIGARVIIHCGAVIGSDGFGYARDQKQCIKIPQIGIVQIDDDVEIGANVCIDRATFGKTWIKRGVKIDNLVQVAHNVVVGEDSIIVSQVGIAGSTTLGRGVVLAGQVGVSGHATLGDGVTVGAKSGVHGSLSPGARVSGIPAIPHGEWLKASSVFQRLPNMLKEMRELRKRLERLEALLKDHNNET